MDVCRSRSALARLYECHKRIQQGQHQPRRDNDGREYLLPRDVDNQVGSGVANGGAGNGIGIAVLDSGIMPCDNAEFVGYQWKQSGGALGTGLLSQTYLAPYDRIKKHIDFS